MLSTVDFGAMPMTQPSRAPSAPSSCDLDRDGLRVVERLRPTPSLGHSPTRTFHVGVDRVVIPPEPGHVANSTGLMFRRAHPCAAHDLFIVDLGRAGLSELGFGLRGLFQEEDGHLDVVVDDCPGVRLRVLADVTVMTGAHFPRPLFHYVAQRTQALAAVFARFGVPVGDTFIGFDGTVHLFPALPRTEHHEQVTADVVGAWDTLVVSVEDVAAQRMRGSSPGWAMTGLGAQALPATSPFQADVPLDDDHTSYREPQLRRWLGHLARSLCPSAFAVHQQWADELGIDIEEEGRRREWSILQAPEPITSQSGLTLHRSLTHTFALEEASVTLAQLGRVLPELREGVDVVPGPPGAPACGVSLETATRYAARIGRRLPTCDEWTSAAVAVPDDHPWQLTSTPGAQGGVIVCGGRWRNRPDAPANAANQSWEDAPANDVGFRCAVDVTNIRGDVHDADFYAGTVALPR